MSTCGIMNPSNFVGKAELLRWLNDFFEIRYTKVEQACTGSMHCQILDAVFPGKVPLHKVNFNATQEYQYVNNYKVLQSVFNKQKIAKHVEVQRLVKGKYQDNLEFLQWMKHFFESRWNGQEYNALERRESCMRRYGKSHKHARSSRPAMRRENKENAAPRGNTNGTATSTATSKVNTSAPRRNPAPKTRRNTRDTKATQRKSQDAKIIEEKDEEIAELHSAIENVAKERNFYFDKLREVEILLRQLQDAKSNEGEGPSADTLKVCDDVLHILYKENDEFVAPAGEEQEQEQVEE